jgi:hypothetical protein
LQKTSTTRLAPLGMIIYTHFFSCSSPRDSLPNENSLQDSWSWSKSSTEGSVRQRRRARCGESYDERERERERERKRAQSVREEMGVGARSQSERGGGMGSKAAGRQACEGKQAALDTDEQSARRGGNKRKWGTKRKQRAGHKRCGKKARDLRSWSSLTIHCLACLPPCLPPCLPASFCQ